MNQKYQEGLQRLVVSLNYTCNFVDFNLVVAFAIPCAYFSLSASLLCFVYFRIKDFSTHDCKQYLRNYRSLTIDFDLSFCFLVNLSQRIFCLNINSVRFRLVIV